MKLRKRLKRAWRAFRWPHDWLTLQISVNEEGKTTVWVDGREQERP